MDKAIQKEVERLKAGPQIGGFTFLHHEGPIVEKSDNVMERVNFILARKPAAEILMRLQHIWPVPEQADKLRRETIEQADKLHSETIEQAYKLRRETIEQAYKLRRETIEQADKLYSETIEQADKLYRETREQAYKLYRETIEQADKAILDLVPNCGWDGKTIFGSKREA